MTTATYNGWKSYPTWVTHLWITNDQGTDEMAREVVAGPFDCEAHCPRVEAGDLLREWVGEVYELPTAGLAADLIGHALDGVDWLEIVDALREES